MDFTGGLIFQLPTLTGSRVNLPFVSCSIHSLLLICIMYICAQLLTNSKIIFDELLGGIQGKVLMLTV